jgi:microcystin-dependent protein
MPNWYEKLIDSNPDVANNNDDDDRDGWTLLEGYLEFMANPYLIVKPGEQATIDVKQFFKGFTKSPAYSITTDSSLFTAAVNGSVITVTGGEYGGIGVITMKVTDSEGTTYEKRLSIAVSGEVTGIENVWSEADIDVAKREFFTLDGKQVTTMKQHELYIMKITDNNGNVHSVKVIKN